MTSSNTLSALAIRLRGGLTVCVPPSLRVTTTYVLLEQEAWFEDEVDFVRNCLCPGECAVDVGANFGIYATAMAEAVGPEGKIIAFEPSAETSRYLRTTIGLKGGTHVEAVQAAVSDHVGQAQFHIGITPELSGLAGSVADSTATETVHLTTLDEHLVRRDGRPVSFIKVDAEGHELPVGLGARKLLTRDEPLVMFEIKHGKGLEFQFLDFLESLGWSGYRLVPGLQMLVPFKRDAPIDGYQLNLFGCSNARAAQLHERGLLIREFFEEPCPVLSRSSPPVFQFGTPPAPGSAYDLALSHFASAQQSGLEPNQRFAHLRRAGQEAERAVAEKNSLARCATLARIATDIGDRSIAVRALSNPAAAVSLTRVPLEIPDEPCLPTSSVSGFKKDASPEALRIAALESLERLRAYSSLLADPKSLPFLEFICRHPLSSPEMHRRRQLRRLTAGLQAKPEPEPKLVQESAANLNAWFWRGEIAHRLFRIDQ